MLCLFISLFHSTERNKRSYTLSPSYRQRYSYSTTALGGSEAFQHVPGQQTYSMDLSLVLYELLRCLLVLMCSTLMQGKAMFICLAHCNTEAIQSALLKAKKCSITFQNTIKKGSIIN